MDQKAKIFLERTLKRVETGEFDEHLSIPFASRKLMKAVIVSKMNKKVENNSTPVFSDAELYEIVEDVRITAAETASAFAKMGLLKDEGEGHGISSDLQKAVYPRKPKQSESE